LRGLSTAKEKIVNSGASAAQAKPREAGQARGETIQRIRHRTYESKH